MRSREEIEKEVFFLKEYGLKKNYNRVILELILDVRDMLKEIKEEK